MKQLKLLIILIILIVISVGVYSIIPKESKKNYEFTENTISNNCSSNSFLLQTFIIWNQSLINKNYRGNGIDINPLYFTYDPLNKQIFLSFINSGEIYIISAFNYRIIHKLQINGFVSTMVYDPANKIIYVGNQYTDNITLISAESDAIIGNITVRDPSLLTLDNETGNIYSLGYYDGIESVYEISGATNQIIDNITLPVQYGWSDMVFDYFNGNIYIVNYETSQMLIISTLNNAIIGRLDLGSTMPISAGFNKNYIYVTASMINSVMVFSSVNESFVKNIKVGETPFYVVCNENLNEAFVTDGSSNNISVISCNTNQVVNNINVGVFPTFMMFINNNTLVDVNRDSGSLSIISFGYKVIFMISGLPNGTEWSVNVDNITENSTSNSITFILPCGYYNYTINVPSNYSINPSAGHINVNSQNVTISIFAENRNHQSSGITNSNSYFIYIAAIIIVLIIVIAFVVIRRAKGS